METKHDKKLCAGCKYRGTIGSRTTTGSSYYDIVCDYGMTSEEKRSCLTSVHGEVIDRRGDKYEECLLREEGEQIGRARNTNYDEPKKIHKTVRRK